jgi:hypothetical protein
MSRAPRGSGAAFLGAAAADLASVPDGPASLRGGDGAFGAEELDAQEAREMPRIHVRVRVTRLAPCRAARLP